MRDASGREPSAFVWWGTASGLEALIVPPLGIPFRTVPAAPFVGVGPLGRLRNLGRLAGGVALAWRAMGAEQPEALLVTGGYVSVPLAIAARLRRVPLLVYLPDVRPGRAVGLIARLADRIAVTCEPAARHFPPEKVRVTGYPVRAALRGVDRAAARAALGIPADAPLLLAFGGSQGARRINEALAASLDRLPGNLHILHISGARDFEAARLAHAALPQAQRERYRVAEYLQGEGMARALAAADLALCRAGAATLGELPALGLPAILVPLPIAGGHQADNARVLEAAGAALVIPDEALDEALPGTVQALLADPARLPAMARAMHALDRPGAAEAIWRLLEALAAAKTAPAQAASRS